eukprot:jgi/Chrzof1/10561/Cz05g03140.t1
MLICVPCPWHYRMELPALSPGVALITLLEGNVVAASMPLLVLPDTAAVADLTIHWAQLVQNQLPVSNAVSRWRMCTPRAAADDVPIGAAIQAGATAWHQLLSVLNDLAYVTSAYSSAEQQATASEPPSAALTDEAASAAQQGDGPGDDEAASMSDSEHAALVQQLVVYLAQNGMWSCITWLVDLIATRDSTSTVVPVPAATAAGVAGNGSGSPSGGCGAVNSNEDEGARLGELSATDDSKSMAHKQHKATSVAEKSNSDYATLPAAAAAAAASNHSADFGTATAATAAPTWGMLFHSCVYRFSDPSLEQLYKNHRYGKHPLILDLLAFVVYLGTVIGVTARCQDTQCWQSTQAVACYTMSLGRLLPYPVLLVLRPFAAQGREWVFLSADIVVGAILLLYALNLVPPTRFFVSVMHQKRVVTWLIMTVVRPTVSQMRLRSQVLVDLLFQGAFLSANLRVGWPPVVAIKYSLSALAMSCSLSCLYDVWARSTFLMVLRLSQQQRQQQQAQGVAAGVVGCASADRGK